MEHRYYKGRYKAVQMALKHGIDPKTIFQREEDRLWVVKVPAYIRTKTHCKRGHELIDAHRTTSGGCRICKNGLYRMRYKPKTHCIRGHELTPETRLGNGHCRICDKVKKTHCKRGHELTPENRTTRGACLLCVRHTTRLWRQSLKLNA